jgi:hypothetical protein
VRRAVAVGALAAVMLTGTSPAAGTWSDSATVTGMTVTTGSLPPAATLDCDEELVDLSNGVRIAWTPTSTPTTLVYTARVVQTGNSVNVQGNSSVELKASLLATLFGAFITIRVTGTLPGNPPGVGWVTTADQQVEVGLAGLYVNCA